MLHKIKYYACSNVYARNTLKYDKGNMPIERKRLQEKSIEGFQDLARTPYAFEAATMLFPFNTSCMRKRKPTWQILEMVTKEWRHVKTVYCYP